MQSFRSARNVKPDSLIISLGLAAGLIISSPAFGQLSDPALRKALEPSVVRIEVTGVLSTGEVGRRVNQYGTGFFISETGYILTAGHTFVQGDGQAFAGLPTVKVYLSDDDSQNAPISVKYADIKIDSTWDAALVKVPANADNPFIPATVCKAMLSKSTPLMALGYPGKLALSAKSGPLDSLNGDSGSWQTGITTTYGMSGGPVATRSAQVVALIERGISVGPPGNNASAVADIATAVMPLSSLLTLLNAGGAQLRDCSMPSTEISVTSHYIDQQLNELYAPIYMEMTTGAANFQAFQEQFRTRFGRTHPVQYHQTEINGRIERTPISMTEPEWQTWMKWVKETFYPENQRIAALLHRHAALLEGGILTPCLKSLLLHFAAFEQSYKTADSSVRIWAPDHGWPQCIDGEIENTIARLTSERARLLH
jgi:hypothetical protein